MIVGNGVNDNESMTSDEAMPYPYFQNQFLSVLSKVNSEMVKQNYVSKYNSQQSAHHQQKMESLVQSKIQTKVALTRSHLAHMNSKQREVRKMHIRFNSRPTNATEGLRVQSSGSMVLLGSSRDTSRPKTSLTHKRQSSDGQRPFTGRPLTSPQLAIPRSSSCRQVTSSPNKPPKRDPLVVYPFQNHLRSKRIDDNPKLLERVIKKKYQQDPQQLYRFVNSIMLRRKT